MLFLDQIYLTYEGVLTKENLCGREQPALSVLRLLWVDLWPVLFRNTSNIWPQICMRASCLYICVSHTGDFMYVNRAALLFFERAAVYYLRANWLCVQFVDKTYSFAPRAKIMYVNWDDGAKLICTRITPRSIIILCKILFCGGGSMPLCFYNKYI